MKTAWLEWPSEQWPFDSGYSLQECDSISTIHVVFKKNFPYRDLFQVHNATQVGLLLLVLTR